LRRVFKHRLFTYKEQQRKKKKTPLRTQEQFPASFSAPAKPEISRSSAGRISLSVSLMVHLIIFLFAIFYVIDKRLVEESHVVVDITRPTRQRPRRRRRLIPQVKHMSSARRTTTVPQNRKVITTTTQIPVTTNESVILAAMLPSVDEQIAGAFQGWKEIRPRAITPIRQASSIQPVTSPISTMSSRLDIVAPTQTVQTDTLQLFICRYSLQQ